jgi:hypothetical protein
VGGDVLWSDQAGCLAVALFALIRKSAAAVGGVGPLGAALGTLQQQNPARCWGEIGQRLCALTSQFWFKTPQTDVCRPPTPSMCLSRLRSHLI